MQCNDTNNNGAKSTDADENLLIVFFFAVHKHFLG